MISPLEEAKERILRIKERSEQIVIKAIEEMDSQILELQIEQTTQKGQDGLGVELPGPYAPFTVEIKKAKGQRYDIITLYDEGDFHRSKSINFSDVGFEVVATDWKTDKLISEWGEDIMGIQKDNLEIISNDMKDYIYQPFKKIINGDD